MSRWLLAIACSSGPEVVDVRAAPAASAGALIVVGGTPRLDLAGVYERPCPGSRSPPGRGRSGCVDHHFYAIPLVPAEWKPSEPVPAWLTCPADLVGVEACRAHLGSGRAEGDVMTRFGTRDTGWDTAIDDAAARHGLASAPRAPVVLVRAAP